MGKLTKEERREIYSEALELIEERAVATLTDSIAGAVKIVKSPYYYWNEFSHMEMEELIAARAKAEVTKITFEQRYYNYCKYVLQSSINAIDCEKM